ncbi:hypothetical protein [Aquicoccus sp. SU-CL01552]|uniref:hypothetical protein n=1 Tax=Aquicoccus sp. SU-CL01552 TaxID=3127656 RepID=UPI0031071E50
MKTSPLTLALGFVVTAITGAARGEHALVSMHDIVSLGPTAFGLFPERGAIVLNTSVAPHRAPVTRGPFTSSPSKGQAAQLRDLIGHAEASRAGYDSVQHGARTPPSKRPTEMTVGEIFAWIAATPGQPHAIGRYQFIPKTLRSLVGRGKIGMDERFSRALQDHLADMLLADAGFDAFQSGQMSQEAFMYNLAGIWAGLPLPSGRSRYHGYAGNRATISWTTYQTEIALIYARR